MSEIPINHCKAGLKQTVQPEVPSSSPGKHRQLTCNRFLGSGRTGCAAGWQEVSQAFPWLSPRDTASHSGDSSAPFKASHS